MNRFFSILTVVLLFAACKQSPYAKTPITAPDRQAVHNAALCPYLNDTFVGENTKRTMILHTTLDKKHAMILEDVGFDSWVIDGKGHPRSGYQGQSYVAYCTSATSSADNKPDMTANGNIVIEGYDSTKTQIFTISYVSVTNGAFAYSHLDGAKKDVEPPDTYKVLTK